MDIWNAYLINTIAKTLAMTVIAAMADATDAKTGMLTWLVFTEKKSIRV